MSKLDTVWETHDFVINKLTENEDKYNNLLSTLPTWISMFESGGVSREEFSKAVSSCEKTTRSLRSLYHKHLFTIKEIRILMQDDDVPPERVVVAEVIDELESSTKELLESMDYSDKLFKFIRAEHQL